jgi:hypothetical protein
MEEMKVIQDKPNKINGSEVDAVKEKLRPHFSKNKGFKVICDISCASEEEDTADSEDLKDLSTDFVYYKYAQLVSCGMERTFYQNKSLLRDNRHRQLKDVFRCSLQ